MEELEKSDSYGKRMGIGNLSWVVEEAMRTLDNVRKLYDQCAITRDEYYEKINDIRESMGLSRRNWKEETLPEPPPPRYSPNVPSR